MNSRDLPGDAATGGGATVGGQAGRNGNLLSRSAGFKSWVWIVPLVALWIDVFAQLRYQWSANEAYAHGWFVPFLGALLFWRRWQLRPPSRPRLRFKTWEWSVLGLILAFGVARFCHEANPDWPMMSWLLVASLSSLTFYLLYRHAGRAWARHFLFPIAFSCLAVRWPWRIEQPLVHTLAFGVTRATVEILGWIGIPALQHGRVIEIAVGRVGVEDACSGLRSLQAAIIIATFLGEFRLLTWGRRLALVGTGVAGAYLLNVVRTFVLTWRTSVVGLAGAESWHDPSGIAVLILLFGLLWGQCEWLARGALLEAPEYAAPVTSPQAVTGFPGWLGIAFAGWVALVLIGTEAWFRAHELRRPKSLVWWGELPADVADFQRIPEDSWLSRRLKHDELKAGTWREPDGTLWSAYYIHWKPGPVGSRIVARSHRPELCLAGAGFKLLRDLGIKDYRVRGETFGFRRYIFVKEGVPVYVFFCLREYGPGALPLADDFRVGDRLRTSWRGVRQVGQRSLEVAIVGVASPEHADERFAQRLSALLAFSQTPGLVDGDAAR